MSLRKTPLVTVIPADPGQPYRAPSTVCTPPPPDDNSGGNPPSNPGTGDSIYLHVPNDPGDPNAGSTMVDALAPAPPGYTCGYATAFVPDPLFPGGLIPVIGIHCYWNY